MTAARPPAPRTRTRRRSPAALAWLRFRQHRLAMAGLLGVGAVATGVMLVPAYLRMGPDEARPWIGAHPPLFAHPDCAVENVFTVGRTAETTASLASRRSLRFHVQIRRADVYRITLRGGRIHTLQLGAKDVEALDLALPAQPACEQLENGAVGRELPRALLRAGEPPPEGLFAPGQRVVFAVVTDRSAAQIVDVALAEGGLVTAVRVRTDGEAGEGAARDTVTLRGEEIDDVRDAGTGRPLRVRHVFGTDELGRDLLVRVCYGGRISLLIGLVATAVSVLIGVAYGAVSGYCGGRTDRALMGAVDVLYALPFLFLVIVFMVMFGRNIVMLFVALGAVQWLTMARIVRGQVLSLKQMPFVDAARLCGARPGQVVFRHLLPHALGPVAVYTTLTVPVVIMEESFLSFLGLQVQYRGVALDSWGSLISRGVQALGEHGEKGWLLLFPSAVMVLTLVGLNALGDGLRDSLDPRGRTS